MQNRPYRTVVVTESESALRITLNRPDRRNAIGSQMINELLHALEDAIASDSVRSIVLTGAGNTFCAGGDFAHMNDPSESPELPMKGDFKDLLLAMCRTTKPIIARVNGHAMGGGLGLVAASTFAVASTESKLGTPEINVGLFPFMIFSVLERVMPRRALVEMVLSGSRLSAEEAMKVGLINRAVAPAELDEAVDAYVRLVASKSPMTMKLGLEAMRDVDDLTMPEKLPILSSRLLQCLGTEDAREGLTAFMQKRDPKWTGR